MTVSITSLATGVTRTQSDQSARLSAALSGSANLDATSPSSTISPAPAGTNPASSASIDSLSSGLKTHSLSFRLGSLHISFVGSKLETIDSGAQQVSRILGQLQSLASQASAGGLSDSALELLDGQFQALSLSIDDVPPGPPGAQFTASSVVDGLSSGEVAPSTTADAATSGDAILGGFSATNLLGSSNLLSTDSAQQALATVNTAISNINSQRTTISSLQDTVDFAAASAAGAIQNQEAASSTLTPEDLAGETSVSLQASLQAQPNAALAAQTGNLPNDILQLLA